MLLVKHFLLRVHHVLLFLQLHVFLAGGVGFDGDVGVGDGGGGVGVGSGDGAFKRVFLLLKITDITFSMIFLLKILLRADDLGK